ncbi:MAG: ABC transporter ATP-binding protein [Clostridia bacterium]|nr:ABC transporter ATP-binding protein [Clostridia bacterium]
MKRYLKYLNGAWIWVILAPVLMILEVFCDLRQPDIMSDIVDVGIRGGAGYMYILNKGIEMMGVAIVGMIGGVGCGYFATKASQYFGYRLRDDIYKKIQEFSFSNIDKFSTASLITRTTNDVVMLQNIVGMALRMMVRSPMLFVGGIIYAVRLQPKLAVIFLIAIPLIVGIIAINIKKTFPLFKVVQGKLDKVNAVIQENLTGIRVVKAYNRAEHETKRFGEANDDYVDISIRAHKLMALMMPGVSIVMNISVVAIMWFGATLVGAGDMEVGDVSAFIMYATRILSSIMMMSMMFMSLSRASASAARISEVLDEKVDIVNGKAPRTEKVKEGRVEFKNVSFRYRGAGGEDVLKNLTFSVEPGETLAILGSTGSGKSTLVNLIPRLYDVTGGQVVVDGTDVRDYDIETLREGIGMVLQNVILFSGTIKENLRWGKDDATEEEMREAAERAQAAEFISKNPDGYDAVLSQRGVNFSGGQKQRLSIARALIKKPKILIFDDSTSAVDTATEGKIRKTLREEMGESTLILIAQRISAVRDADKILVMENGEIVGMGNHDELMANNSVYQEIYYSQMEKEGEE